MVFVAFSSPASPNCVEIGSYSGRTIYKSNDGLVSFVADVDVNTDGSPKSYHPDDPGYFASGKLNTHYALNTICNGATIRRADATTLYGPGQCAMLLKEFARLRGLGWSEPRGNYVHWVGVAPKPGSGERRAPCLAPDGYFVSQTARALDASAGVCDPAHWPDALQLSSIVLPLDARMRAAGVRIGDVALVRTPSGIVSGALFLDTNNTRLGEGSVKLAMSLHGSTTAPSSYRGVLALSLPRAEYFVFPGSYGDIAKLGNQSEGDIQTAAKTRAAQYAVDKRKACERISARAILP
jgi:hypothetical protein